MDLKFDIDPAEFQERKRRRISTMNTTAPPAPKMPPTSAPGVHEVATFLPGRLEFEHELDNDAEDLVKDLEFGICLAYGGDQIPEDENEIRELAQAQEDRRNGIETRPAPNGAVANGRGNYQHNGDIAAKTHSAKAEDDKDEDGEEEENMEPPPIENIDSVAFKLSLLDSYTNRVEKRLESKALMFDRGLLEYKKVESHLPPLIYIKSMLQLQAAEKKRPKDEKDIIHRLRPFAKLQSAADYEVFCADILCESRLQTS
jgi:transcriptional adapter 2-alpha